MRLRGYRSLSPLCLLLSLIILLSLLFICLLLHVISQWLIYDRFVSTYRFSSVPFWNDSRLRWNGSEIIHPLVEKRVEEVQLKNSRLVVGACSRNTFRSLPGFRRNVQLIVDLFADYRIYLGESFSTDLTREYLLQWQQNDSEHLRLFIEPQQHFTFQTRTSRIAACRNILLRSILAEWNVFDYYLVFDVDVGSSSSFEVKDFLSNFVYSPSSWLGLTSTQRGEYYDIWALRIEEILPFDCWKVIKGLTSFVFDRSELISRLVHIHQRSIPIDVPLIPVQSAFGGGALYPRSSLHPECFYRGEDPSPSPWWLFQSNEQCEHVSFHRCLLDHSPGKSLFINPRFRIS